MGAEGFLTFDTQQPVFTSQATSAVAPPLILPTVCESAGGHWQPR